MIKNNLLFSVGLDLFSTVRDVIITGRVKKRQQKKKDVVLRRFNGKVQ
jgi:hypothetical protein